MALTRNEESALAFIRRQKQKEEGTQATPTPEAPAAPQPSTERSTPAQTGRLRPGWDVSDVARVADPTAYQQAIREADSFILAPSLSEIARTRQSPSAAAQTATDLESRIEQYSATMDNTQRNMGAMTPALQQARAGVDQRQREFDGYAQKLTMLQDTISSEKLDAKQRNDAIREYNALLPYAKQAAARLDNEVNTYNSLAGQAQQMEAQYNEALLNYQQALPEYDRISSRGNLDAKAFRSEGDKWSQRAKDLEAEANGTEALHPDFTRMTPEQVGEWQQNYLNLRTQAQEANAKASEYRRQEEAAQRRYQNYQYNQLLAGVEKYQTDPNWDKLAKADPEKMKPFGKDASTGIGLYRDSKYAIINGSEAALQDSISARADTWGAVSEVHLTKMNDREKAAYNYLYATKGKDAADAFLKELEPTLNARQRESDRVWWTNYAKEQPWGASAFSVLASPMKAISLFGQAADLIQTGNIDQNAAYNKFSYVPSDLRGAVSEQIEKKWGKAGSFAYQTGMSMADFLFQSAITGEFFGASAGATGLAKLTKPALLIMGSGAAADTVIELRDRGVDSTRAMALGTVAGLAEIVTENVSLENLLNPDKLADGVIRYVLKNMAAEGSEELGSDAINWAADALYDLVSGQDEAEWKYQIRQLQKEGMSAREATRTVLLDMVKQAGLDALGGVISGGVMAGSGALIQRALNSNVGQAARAAAQATRQDLAERNAPAPIEAPEQIEGPAPVEAVAEAQPVSPLQAAVDKLTTGEQLTQNDGRRILRDETAMQTLRDAGVLTETVRDDAAGRQTVRQAVEQYVAQQAENRAQEEPQTDITPAEEAPRTEGLRLPTAEETLTPAPERVNLLATNRTEETNNDTQTPAPAPEARTVRNAPAPAGRQSTRGDGGRGPGLGRFLVQSFRENYRGARAVQQQLDRANRISAQAAARGDLTYFSGSEIAPDGSDEKLGAYAPEEMWDDKLKQTVQDYADKGVKLIPILDQIGFKNGTSARAYVSSDGKQMWVQINHDRLSWEQLVAHEELHRELKVNPGLRAEIIRDLKSDPFIAKNYDRILRKYAEAYKKLGVTDPIKIEEEMLADYRAGFDMMKDTIGRGVMRAKAQESILSTERRVSADGKTVVVDGVAMATDVADTLTESPAPKDYQGATSIDTLPDWAKNYAKIGGENAQQVIDALKAFTDQMVANEAIYGYVPNGKVAYDKAGPLRNNREYVVTFDMDASCPRTFQFTNYRNRLQAIAGRPLTYNESIQLVELMRAYGQQIPCSYCYVENKRVLLSSSYLNWFSYRNNVLSAETDEDARTKMYSFNAKSGGLSNGAEKQLAEWRSGDKSYRPSAVEVWRAVQTARNSVYNYLDQRSDAGLLKSTKPTALAKQVLQHFNVTGKDASAEIRDYVKAWAYDHDSHTPHLYQIPNSPEVSEVDTRALELHRTAMRYANSASSARTVDNYAPYTDQLKKITAEEKKRIMAQGGIRKHSSNDFRMDYVQDYFLFFADLAAGGWTGHTYTKNADYVKIFGRTGDRINISIAYNEDGGRLSSNDQEGMNWKTAQELSRAYSDNVGVMAMVTSDAQLSHALNSDWIDMIIPFHHSGLDKAVWYNLRAWTDYTSKQNERWPNRARMEAELADAVVAVDSGMSSDQIRELYEDTFNIVRVYNENGERVKPHFLPGSVTINGQTIPGHNNDLKTYLALCKQYGVTPRFQGILVDDGQGNQIDVTEHPNYMKLIKETAKAEKKQEPIKFNFDQVDSYLGMTPFEYAMQRMEEEARIGGYANTAEDPYHIVDEFAREYLGKNIPLANNLDDMLTERAKEYREGIAEMQAEDEARQAEVVRESLAAGDTSLETRPSEGRLLQRYTLQNSDGTGTGGPRSRGRSTRGPKEKVSRVRTHAFELGGLYNEVEAQMAETQPEEFTYDPISEKRSMNEALGRLRKDFTGEAEKLASSDQWGGSDLDTAMGILYQYRQIGRETGDYSLFNEWSHVIQQKGTKGGQFVQAFAKYSRTATGMAQKAAENLRETAGKLNPKQQKLIEGHVSDILGAIDNDIEAAARDAVEKSKGKNGLRLPGGNDTQRVRDAENVIKQIHKIFSQQTRRSHGLPVEEWTKATGDQLAGRIASRLKEPGTKTQTTMQTILGDLITFAQEHALPTQEARQHRTALDRITDYLNNREAYAEAWGEAKQVLRDMYADDPEKLDALESFLNATITYNGDDFDRTMFRAILEASDLLGMDKQDILNLAAVGTTESVINRIADEFLRRVGVDDATLRDTVRRHIENIVREGNVDSRLERMESDAGKELDIKIQDLLRESRRTKADAANRIAQYLINDLGISGTDAAIAADHIAGHYMDQLQQRADRVVERMFAEKKTITKKQRDKLLDLIHLGGLTNANVEDAVVDALGLNKVSRAQQRQIMDAMAQFADTLDAIEDNDLEGLRQLIREQAAVRNTKLSSMAEDVLNHETDVEYLRNFALAQLDLIAADYAARSLGEKVSTVQVISHLLNARTAMRNVTSNQIFDLVDSTANNVGLLSDLIMSQITGQRTVGLEKSWASKAKRQGAVKGMGRSILEVALDVAPSDRNKSKYGTGGRRTFSMANSGVVGRILSRAEKIMGYELNTTDEFHKGSVMGETLESLGRFVEAGYMTEEEAAEFAAQEALYRSFQDDTIVGAMLAGLKDVLNIIGTGKTSGKTIRGLPVHDFGLGDLVVKYTQVPGALIHRAIEYSPVGYLKAFYHIAQLGNAKHRGESTIKQQRNAALALGRATTGSGLITLFTLLAKLGLLRRGDDEKDKNAAALKTSQGLGGTQINVSALGRLLNGESAEPQKGDVLYDIGFLEPLDTLMTVAALVNNDPEIKNLNLYEMFRSPETAKKLGEKSLQGIWLALEDTSAMQTLSNIYSTIRYHDEENDLPLYMQIPIEIASSSLSGFVPAPIRQIAQATDTTYRDQYRSQDLLKQTGARVANAIPGLRLQLAPKLTPLGKDKTYQEPWLNALNALVNPGNINIYDTDEVRDELLKVYEETGDGSMLPARNAPYSINIGHESYTLTPDERTEYLRIRGQEETKFVESLLATSWYRNADADTKAAFLNSAKNIANDIAKSQWAAERGITYHDTTYRKYLKMLADGTRYADVIKANNEDLVDTVVLGVPRQVWDDTKEAFNDIANSDISSYDKGVQQRALICDLELNDRQKLVVYGDLANTESREEQFRTVMDTGLSFNETAKIFDKYSEYKSEDETRASQDAKDFALWVDQRQDLTDEQKKVIKEQFKYWQMIPAEAERYEKYTGLGFEPEVANRIDSALSELQPLPGHDSVTNMQRAQAALGALGKNASQSDQMKIVESFYGGSTTNKDGSLSQWGKIKKVTGNGVTVDKTLTMVEDGSLDVYCKWMDSDQKKAGINSDTYIQTVKKYNDTHSEYDKETGKEIKGKTRKDKMISYIDGLNLSVEQKDSLYLMEYKESGLKDTPWHKGGSSGAGKTYSMGGLRLPTPERREPISSGLKLQSAPKAKPSTGGLKLR